MLSLKEISPAFFDYSDFGTYIHYVFEQYVRRAAADGIIGQPPDRDYISKITRECAEEYLLKSFSGGEASSGRLKYRFKRMLALAEFVAYSITKEFADSSFRPEFLELSIGSSRSEPSLSPLIIPTSLGRDLSLSGKIDRVDLWREAGGNIFVRVIDYKSGKKKFSFDDIDRGENLQLPLYLFALCESDKTAFARLIGADRAPLPAGAMYLSSLIPTIDVSDGTDIRDKAEASISRSGFISNDPTVIDAMSHSLSQSYLCGAKSGKDGTLTGAALLSSDRMNELKSKLVGTVTDIGERIISGEMSCAPSQNDGSLRCERCAMRPVCRAATLFKK
jgi:ATP-dependent helicase/nuclease subunit B